MGKSKYYEDNKISSEERLDLVNVLTAERKILSSVEIKDIKCKRERTLIKYISSDTATIDLMDEFESITEEGFHKYIRLLNRKRNSCKYGWYCFIIERLGGRKSIGNITMTKLKQGPPVELLRYINSQIEINLSGQEIKEPVEIIFETPYLLRAQNSSNRTGYGSEYNGYDLVYQGTLYGETTEYAIVGVMFSKNIHVLQYGA